jgi:hypothetical protein
MSETTDKKIQPVSTQKDKEYEPTVENAGPFELYLGFYDLLNEYGERKPYSKESKDHRGRTRHAIKVDFRAPVVQKENEEDGTTEEIVLKGETDMYFARRPFDPAKLSLPFGSGIHLEIRKSGGELALKRRYKAYMHSIVLYPKKNIHTTHMEPKEPGLVAPGVHPGRLDERQKTEVLLKAMQYLESFYQKSKKRRKIR